MTSAQFHNVWLPLQDRFYRVAFHLMEDRFDAEDVVQDLYVKLWNMRDMLDFVNSPVSYGIMMTRNLCIDRIRKRQPLEETNENIESGQETDAFVLSYESLAVLHEAVNKLPPGQRTVLKKRIFEGKSNSEIADELNVRELNVRVQMSLAKKRLKKMLKDEND